jgi:hypothetical protein
MDDRKISLTVFLLKKDRIAEFEKKLFGTNQAAISLSEPLNGRFLPFPSVDGNPPVWVQAVGSILVDPIGADMGAKSPGGLLVIRHLDRTFVISFGQP